MFHLQGVPKNVKLQAEMLVELRRLHEVYRSGMFDWRNTPTTLRWLLSMRRRLAASPSGPSRPPTATALSSEVVLGYDSYDDEVSSVAAAGLALGGNVSAVVHGSYAQAAPPMPLSSLAKACNYFLQISRYLGILMHLADIWL